MKENNNMITNHPPQFPYKNSSHCEHISNSAVFLLQVFHHLLVL